MEKSGIRLGTGQAEIIGSKFIVTAFWLWLVVFWFVTQARVTKSNFRTDEIDSAVSSSTTPGWIILPYQALFSWGHCKVKWHHPGIVECISRHHGSGVNTWCLCVRLTPCVTPTVIFLWPHMLSFFALMMKLFVLEQQQQQQQSILRVSGVIWRCSRSLNLGEPHLFRTSLFINN